MQFCLFAPGAQNQKQPQRVLQSQREGHDSSVRCMQAGGSLHPDGTNRRTKLEERGGFGDAVLPVFRFAGSFSTPITGERPCSWACSWQRTTGHVHRWSLGDGRNQGRTKVIRLATRGVWQNKAAVVISFPCHYSRRRQTTRNLPRHCVESFSLAYDARGRGG